MDASEFEKLLSNRAERIYQDDKMMLLREISAFFDHRCAHMNAHDSGNSLKYEIDIMVNKRIEERKPAIISKIKQKELDRILSSLDSVKFLFESSNQ